MSEFMKKQVTGKERWLIVETSAGTECVNNVFVSGLDWPNSLNLTESAFQSGAEQLQDYCEGTVYSWENVEGFGARLSAPGYLDCTEWTVFDTEKEAWDYLDETYPEEAWDYFDVT